MEQEFLQNSNSFIDLIINELDNFPNLKKHFSTNERITDNVMFQRADINEDGAVDAFDVIHLDLALNGIVPLI